MLKRVSALFLAFYTVSLFNVKPLICADNTFYSLQCDSVMEGPGLGKTEGRFFIKGKKVRMESAVAGSTGVNMVTLYDGQKAYVYFPEQNMAMATSVSSMEQQMPLMKDKEELNKKIIGQEIIDARACDIYQFNDAKGVNYKIWVARDINFPVKSESGGMKTYYKNIRMNVSLDDGIFELPKGAQIQDMSGIMQQQQNILNR